MNPHALSTSELHRMLRVNHAGEYGAKRIYKGQLSVLPQGEDADRIVHMAEQENVHLETFNALMVKHRVRPSLLLPLWHVGGFAMGALTARLGRESAYACTVAVESVIDQHYAEQETVLAASNDPLLETVQTFRAEEQEHHDTSIVQGALNAPAYPLLHGTIQAITRSAIALAKYL